MVQFELNFFNFFTKLALELAKLQKKKSCQPFSHQWKSMNSGIVDLNLAKFLISTHNGD